MKKILEEANDWVNANQKVGSSHSNSNLGFVTKTHRQQNDHK
jgi:hypothetical protein